MHLRKYITLLSVLVIGFIAHYAMLGLNKKNAGYLERHEGQTKHINPLLACDIAEDVISDAELVPFKDQIETFFSPASDCLFDTPVEFFFSFTLPSKNWDTRSGDCNSGMILS